MHISTCSRRAPSGQPCWPRWIAMRAATATSGGCWRWTATSVSHEASVSGQQSVSSQNDKVPRKLRWRPLGKILGSFCTILFDPPWCFDKTNPIVVTPRRRITHELGVATEGNLGSDRDRYPGLVAETCRTGDRQQLGQGVTAPIAVAPPFQANPARRTALTEMRAQVSSIERETDPRGPLSPVTCSFLELSFGKSIASMPAYDCDQSRPSLRGPLHIRAPVPCEPAAPLTCKVQSKGQKLASAAGFGATKSFRRRGAPLLRVARAPTSRSATAYDHRSQGRFDPFRDPPIQVMPAVCPRCIWLEQPRAAG